MIENMTASQYAYQRYRSALGGAVVYSVVLMWLYIFDAVHLPKWFVWVNAGVCFWFWLTPRK